MHKANPSEEMESDRYSRPAAKRLQFEFARLPVTVAAIQRKPTISSHGDPLEREAEDVADKVMRMAEPGPLSSAPVAIHRKCTQCEDEENETKTGRAKEATIRPVALQSVDEQEEDQLFHQAVIFRKAEFATPPTITASAVADRLLGHRAGGSRSRR